MHFLILLGIIITASAFYMTRSFIKLMPKYGIVDKPSERRAHAKETPRAGGLALPFLLTIFLPIAEVIITGTYDYSMLLIPIFLPISVVSLLDDIFSVSIIIRLFTHIICSLAAVELLIHPNTVLHYEISIYLDLALGCLALVSFLNIYNFLDGIDGITASQTIHLSVTIILLCLFSQDKVLNKEIIISISTIILAWAISFIYFNWHPAKIFMGDVGSITIGFLLGICLLTIAASSLKLFAACVIASLYYIADGGLTLLIRMSKGERIWEPHLQHFFQKAAAKGMTHKRVVKRIIKCNLMLMGFAVSSMFYPAVSIIGSFLTVVITLIRSV